MRSSWFTRVSFRARDETLRRLLVIPPITLLPGSRALNSPRKRTATRTARWKRFETGPGTSVVARNGLQIITRPVQPMRGNKSRFLQTDLRHGERLPRGRRHATRTRGCDRGHNHRGQQAPREEQRAQSARHEAQDTQMPVSRMQEGVHQELAPQGPSKDAHGWVNRCKLHCISWFEADSYIESVDELAGRDRYRCEIIRYCRLWHITRTEIIVGVVELSYYYDELHAYSNEYCSPRSVYKHVSASCDKFFKPPRDTCGLQEQRVHN